MKSEGLPHHNETVSRQRMAAAIVITLVFVIGETFAGLYTHSLALLSDAGHNFADALALGFSWYAIMIAAKPSNHRRTFGYHRVAILAALVNAASLVVIALLIFIEAYQRLRFPQPIKSGPMIWVALIAIGINTLVAFWLQQGAKGDVNVRSAYLHMLGDAVSAFGVVIAGIVYALTGSLLADPIASMLIGILIFLSSWGILKETVNTLLEGSPLGLDMSALEQTIKDVPGVVNVHNLHVWTIGPGVIACSCHLVVDEHTIQGGQLILGEVVKNLEINYQINHTTVQIEIESGELNDTYCQLVANHIPSKHLPRK
ncbi:MAG: cation diffusion facilitator family transporter [Pseudomonadota bacterium]